MNFNKEISASSCHTMYQANNDLRNKSFILKSNLSMPLIIILFSLESADFWATVIGNARTSTEIVQENGFEALLAVNETKKCLIKMKMQAYKIEHINSSWRYWKWFFFLFSFFFFFFLIGKILKVVLYLNQQQMITI